MKILKYLLSIILCINIFACNEEEFLKEVPSGIYTADNMYVTKAQFESAVTKLYQNYRSIYYTGTDRPFDFLYGTDFGHNGQGNSGQRFGDYSIALDPTSGIPRAHWSSNYKMIANANTILGRLADSELTDSEKLEAEAQAKFFRAYGYRTLTYLFGGVPLVLEEVTEAKADFVRDTKEACLTQIISDLDFAAANLPAITEIEDGKVSSAAANHLLADVCLAAGQYDKAIAASSAVINDPNFNLMTDRFGTRKNEPGDVYWDLFRRGNQNRSIGNTEGIFVIQFELETPGGNQVSTGWGSAYLAERHHPPLTRDIKKLDDKSQKAPFLWPVSDITGGRGIGWMISTYFFTNTIWEDTQGEIDLSDIRNSQYNLPRYYEYNRPDGPYPLGTIFDCETNPECVYTLSTTGMWPRSMYPYQTKVTTPGNHPEGLYQDPELGVLYGGGGATYTDWYDMRLGETYLIRAEAYLAKGDKNNAAADINTLRTRAGATLATESDIDIDFILDERLRELGFEEKRRLTLMRLGKLVERVVAYNPFNANNVLPKHDIFPIPQSEIEANIDAVLEQNSAYK